MHSERPTFPTGREPRGSCLHDRIVNLLDDDNGSGLMASVFSDFQVWNILNPAVNELGTNVHRATAHLRRSPYVYTHQSINQSFFIKFRQRGLTFLLLLPSNRQLNRLIFVSFYSALTIELVLAELLCCD